MTTELRCRDANFRTVINRLMILSGSGLLHQKDDTMRLPAEQKL
jgi:hypothetical protein